MRLLVHMPSRERPRRMLQVVDMYRRLQSGKHDVVYSFSIDEDDRSMNQPAMLTKLRQVGRVNIGQSKSKVEACNAGIDSHGRDFDILLLASDDMTPITKGWDAEVADQMDGHFPNLDGALWFNDGRVGNKLCTFPICGVNLYKKFGYVYHPSYISLACDNEWMDQLTQLRRLPYINRVLFRHDHHSFAGQSQHRDGLYLRNDAFMDRDSKNFHERAKIVVPGSRFNFGFPPIRLSILIPTLRSRKAFLDRILGQLNDQINGCDIIKEVEIVIDRDGGEAPVGLKRQRLLDRALGDYIAFVDDDDKIAPNYCRRIVEILRRESPDCVGIVGEYTVDGQNPRKFIHSTKNPKPGWYEERGVYYRGPNHLNPVKRELALKAGFPTSGSTASFGEDHDYSNRLANAGLCKTEVFIPETMYYYLARSKK